MRAGNRELGTGSRYFLQLFYCFPFFLVISCTPASEYTTVQLGFYHWRTVLDIQPIEQRFLDSLPVEKLYIKFFDIDWDFNKQEPLPKASLLKQSAIASTIEIVPTLFITNRTFQQIEFKDIDRLVINITQKLSLQINDFPAHKISTVQIDCDWTLSTKEPYFYFLKNLQQQLGEQNITLTTTIRLHQIKFFEKTGVPPVSKGLLMFYNMGEVMNLETENSILDNAIAQKYITHLPHYPLPLDIALPLFQWGVLFRNGKMIQLINQLEASDLNRAENFQPIAPNQWKVIKSTYLDGLYLYEDDIIRIEKVQYPDLQAAIRLLQPYFTGQSFDLVFYHLDEEVLKHFSIEQIQTLVTTELLQEINTL